MASNTAVLRIDLGNDAFGGDDLGPELARILRDLAGRLEDQSRVYLAGNGKRSSVRDINGNAAGNLCIEIAPPDTCPECDEPDAEDNGHSGDRLEYRCTACDHRFGPGAES